MNLLSRAEIRRLSLLKRLSDELFAFLQRASALFGSSAYPRTPSLAPVMVTWSGAIWPTWQSSQYRPPILVSGCHDTGPDRSCGALRNSLPLERPLTLGCKLLIYLLNQVLEEARVHVTTQLRLDDSRMNSRGTHAALAVPLVESNSEEGIPEAPTPAWMTSPKTQVLERELCIATSRRATH